MKLTQPPGTARLWVVIPVTIACYFYSSNLEYALPLYFGALHLSPGRSYPYDMWAELIKYQITPWLFAPMLAGLLARRFGERIVWSAALFSTAVVPAVLVFTADPWIVKLLAFWQGLAGAMMWIAGLSLVQMVAPGRKGLSNGLMMASTGLGSILGPLTGRGVLYHRELAGRLGSGEFNRFFSQFFQLSPMQTVPRLEDFSVILWLTAAAAVSGAIAVGWAGQRPGEFAGQAKPDWVQIKRDIRSLVGNPKFWALALVLCGIGAPIFQSSNQFLPYRADDLGLKKGAIDHGWLWLQLLKTCIWLPGGLSVGLIAGRRAPGAVAAVILAGFAIAGLGIGLSRTPPAFFAFVAFFEFSRQFMRWLNGGYLSEHMANHLRATAIGFSITIAGCASTLYAWIATLLWRPGAAGFDSARPFFAVGVMGLIGAAALVIFDRFLPIRVAAPVPAVNPAGRELLPP